MVSISQLSQLFKPQILYQYPSDKIDIIFPLKNKIHKMNLFFMILFRKNFPHISNFKYPFSLIKSYIRARSTHIRRVQSPASAS